MELISTVKQQRKVWYEHNVQLPKRHYEMIFLRNFAKIESHSFSGTHPDSSTFTDSVDSTTISISSHNLH